MEQEIFIKYFTGTISQQEEAALLEWVYADEANRKEYLNLRKVWDMYLLNRAHEEPIISFGQLLAGYNRRLIMKTSKTPVRWARELMKVAAIFLLAFGIGFYANRQTSEAYKPLYHTIEVPSGQRVKLTLSDGSLVWLNAQSKLTYPAVFDKNERTVTLDGEGLFEIAHNEQQPFTVQTAKHKIRVFGTTFDVYAYSNSNTFETILIDGAVTVTDLSDEQNYQLQPGYRLYYQEATQQMHIAKVNTDDYISWKNGIYNFNDIAFEEMIRRLSHYYKTKFVVNDSSVLDYRCTGKFRQHESITNIMDVVKSDILFQYTYDKESNLLIIEPNKKRNTLKMWTLER